MSAAPVTLPMFFPAISLARRELVRFLRQRSRIVGALGIPLVFWLLLGSGMRNSLKGDTGGSGLDYLHYSFPGMMVLIVLFTAIFSMISVIEDRREGFLQGVLVAPISPLAVVGGKVLGSTILALIQALCFLTLAPLAGISLTGFGVLACGGAVLVIAVALSGLGFLIAWPMESTQGFHAIMNLVLMPMWLLSGAFFPGDGASTWVRWIMKINPLTYGVTMLRGSIQCGASGPASHASWTVPWLVSIGFAIGTLTLATRLVRGR